jgi:hypothetical protein
MLLPFLSLNMHDVTPSGRRFFREVEERCDHRPDVEPNNVRKGHSRTIEHGLKVVECEPELLAQVSRELWFPIPSIAAWPEQ